MSNHLQQHLQHFRHMTITCKCRMLETDQTVYASYTLINYFLNEKRSLSSMTPWPACDPKGYWFDSQSRAQAWVAGQVPSRGCERANHTFMFLSLFLSPFPLSKNK